jgi:rod shape determining protein RodA
VIDRLITFLTRHLDPFLGTVVAVLLSLGLVVLFSASGESFGRIGSQLANILVAVTVMWIAANVAPQHMLRLAVPVYVLGLALLVAVALFGDEAKGARRWLDIGVSRIQPSEIMKIGVPLMLAWYFDRYEAILKLKDYVIGTIVLVVPVALIAAQPDLGTAILVAAAGFFVLFLAGLSWKVLAVLGAAAAASLPVLWGMMHDYQRQRVLTLIDPEQDPLGRGYHTIQSTIALGSGGVFGKGWLNGTQARLDFLPERTTDFIFAV